MFYGLWPKLVSPIHAIVAIGLFYLLILMDTTLTLMMVPSISNLEEFIKVFIMLPFILTSTMKHLTFLMKNGSISEFKSLINELRKDPECKPFRETAARSIRLLIILEMIALAISLIGDALHSVAVHEITTAFWMPQSWKESGDAFWLYYAIERVNSVVVSFAVESLDLFTHSCFILFDVFGKYAAMRTRALKFNDSPNCRREFIETVKYHQNLIK